MAPATELIDLETELETVFNPEALKGLIMEEIMQANDQWASCINSFALVAIQRFISHCKDHCIDPLKMTYEDIQKFMDDCLQKELYQEIKNQN